MYYRKGDCYYSHHRVWQNHARRIFGINYTTYANYLRRDVSQLPDLMEDAIRTVRSWMNSSMAGYRRVSARNAKRETAHGSAIDLHVGILSFRSKPVGLTA